MIGLLAGYWLGRDAQPREVTLVQHTGAWHDDDNIGAAAWAVVLVLPAIVVFMPVLLWVAVRDAGRSRLEALVAVAGGIALAGLAGLLWAWWWSVAVAGLIGLVALVHITVRAGRDRRRDEAYK